MPPPRPTDAARVRRVLGLPSPSASDANATTPSPPPPPPLTLHSNSLVVVWFRGHDLRVNDHPALDAAVASGARVVALFVHERFEAPHPSSSYGRCTVHTTSTSSPAGQPPDPAPALSRVPSWYLHHSLLALSSALSNLGITLVLRNADHSTAAVDVAVELSTTLRANAVVWNECYLPQVRAVDILAASKLTANGISARAFHAETLLPPEHPVRPIFPNFSAYGRFWASVVARHPPPRPSAPLKPENVRPLKRADVVETLGHLLSLDDLCLLSGFNPDGLHESPGDPQTVGCEAAKRTLANFLTSQRLARFASNVARRDGMVYATKVVTSRLSPHIRFGEISPRVLFYEVVDAGEDALKRNDETAVSAVRHFLKNVSLREFGYYTLTRFPEASKKPIIPEFDLFPWQDDPDGRLQRAWERGATGFPIVDAAMRQLWREGWLHNRMRFLIASFLVKYLLLPWPIGAAHLVRTLIDGDEACNSLGWQWTAGCNSDSFPFSTLINPLSFHIHTTSLTRAADYVREYVPELAHLPDNLIFAPWRATPEECAKFNIRLVSLEHYNSLTNNRLPPMSRHAPPLDIYPVRAVDGKIARNRSRSAMDVMRRIFAYQKLGRPIIVDQFIKGSAVMHRFRNQRKRRPNRERVVLDDQGQAMWEVDITPSEMSTSELTAEGKEDPMVNVEYPPMYAATGYPFPSDPGSSEVSVDCRSSVRKRRRTGESVLEPSLQSSEDVPVDEGNISSLMTLSHAAGNVSALTTSVDSSRSLPSSLSKGESPSLSRPSETPQSRNARTSHKRPSLQEDPSSAPSSPCAENTVSEGDAQPAKSVKRPRRAPASPLCTGSSDRLSVKALLSPTHPAGMMEMMRPRPSNVRNETSVLQGALPKLAQVASYQQPVPRYNEEVARGVARPCTELSSPVAGTAGTSTASPTLSRPISSGSQVASVLASSSALPVHPTNGIGHSHGSDAVSSKPNAATPSMSNHEHEQTLHTTWPTALPIPQQPPPQPSPQPSPQEPVQIQRQMQGVTPQTSVLYADGQHVAFSSGLGNASLSGETHCANGHGAFVSSTHGVGTMGSVERGHFSGQRQSLASTTTTPSANGFELPSVYHTPLAQIPGVVRGHYGAASPMTGHGTPQMMMPYQHLDGSVAVPHLGGAPGAAAFQGIGGSQGYFTAAGALAARTHAPHGHAMMWYPAVQPYMDIRTGLATAAMIPPMVHPAAGMVPYGGGGDGSGGASPMVAAAAAAVAAAAYGPNGASAVHSNGAIEADATRRRGPSNPHEREAIARRMAAMDYHDDTFGGRHWEQWQAIALHLLNSYEFSEDTDRETSRAYVRLCVLKDELRDANPRGPRVTVNHCKEVFKILCLPVTGEWDRRGHGGVRGPYVYGCVKRSSASTSRGTSR